VKHILLVTNADMSVQAGDVVLVSRRAEELFRQHGFVTTCLILKHQNLEIRHSHPGIDYRTIDGRIQIEECITELRPEIIIFYGEMIYRYVDYVKRILKAADQQASLFLDIQGVLEEMVEYAHGINLLVNRIKYMIKKRILVNALNKVDGALVVSDELKEYCLALLKNKRHMDFEFIKIRCGISEVLSTGQKMAYRRTVRKSWGINDDTIVYVFSGYRKPWQNLDRIKEMFRNIDYRFENVFFVFFCNLDDRFQAEITESFPRGNFFLKFLSFDEYFQYLCACDVGYLLRDYNTTNKVAFPNKFSDYLNAGLLVAMNRALPEPARVLEERHLVFIDVELDDEEAVNKKVIWRQGNLEKYYLQTESLCREEILYSTQIGRAALDIGSKRMIALDSNF